MERDRPGLTLGAAGEQAGLHGFSYGELVFDGCEVPAANRIGREGQGLDVAYSSSVLYGRANLTAVALGIHRAIVEDTVAFCRQREHYGKRLSDLPTGSNAPGRRRWPAGPTAGRGPNGCGTSSPTPAGDRGDGLRRVTGAVRYRRPIRGDFRSTARRRP